jgi:hypothetical protein
MNLTRDITEAERELFISLFLHVVLGLLPLLINLFIVIYYSPSPSFSRALPPMELFFFSVVLSASTIFAIHAANMRDLLSNIGFFIMAVVLAFSIVFYGIAAKSSLEALRRAKRYPGGA